MNKELVYQKKVDALTFLLFFIVMAILIFLKWLPIWAAATAAAFVAVTLRQFMIGTVLDIFASLLFFGLLFLTNTYYISELWTGILLILGSGYGFIRICFDLYTLNLQQSMNSHHQKEHSSLDEDDPED